MFPQICALYVVLGNADPIAFAYSYSESGCLDTGSPAYGSIDIVSVGTLLSASVFWTPIYLILKHWYAHIRYQLIGMQYVPVSFIRYQLIGMRNVSLSVMGYRLIGMQYVSVLIMRYRLIGMQNTSVSIIR